MPNCDFYAVGQDVRAILDFMFDQPGWLLIEHASRGDMPLRRFHSTEDVLTAFDLERATAHLHLYTPEMRGAIMEQRVVYQPGAVPGPTGRTDAGGWGLIQFYLAPADEQSIGVSHTNHNSEARARAWEPIGADRLGPVDAWDWQAVTRVSRRLNYQIRKLAVGRSSGRAILPEAAALVSRGALLARN